MNRRLLFGVIVLLLSACSKEEKPTTQIPYSYFNEPIVNTGYYAYDLNGSPIRIIGIPNTKREAETPQGDIRMVTYPNPAWIQEGEFLQANWSVDLAGPIPAVSRKAFLIRASTTGDDTANGAFFNGSYHHVIGENTIVWEGEYSRNFRISLPVSETGDYRLYLEMDGYYLYDNLAIREFLTY
ncbi:MAG TPA: hypothetical protein VJ949_02120 [Cryomorphaceae bacterium]|nr:hypothetical protein [Cryomorphaceae bacterium]HKL39290.1 hypothetical protein [Cryomorphaceae bacterium]